MRTSILRRGSRAYTYIQRISLFFSQTLRSTVRCIKFVLWVSIKILRGRWRENVRGDNGVDIIIEWT